MVDERKIEAAILAAVQTRGQGSTLCPSEVARALSTDWRALMPEVRRVAQDLAGQGRIAVTQRGRPVDAKTAKGPIRLGPPTT